MPGHAREFRHQSRSIALQACRPVVVVREVVEIGVVDCRLALSAGLEPCAGWLAPPRLKISAGLE